MKNEEIMVAMKNFITSGKWKKDERIPSELELATTFSVSRNTIRGLIQRLTAVDALEIRHGQGTFVKNNNFYNYILNSFIPIMALEDNELVDMLEFQKEVEVESTKLVALNRDDSDLSNMFECLIEMKKHMFDTEKYASDLFNLHISIVTATKNVLIREMIVKLKDVFYTQVMKNAVIPIANSEIEGYEKFYAAILKRDYVQAQNNLRDITNKNIERIKKNLTF